MTFNWKLMLFATMTMLLAIAIILASHYRSALNSLKAERHDRQPERKKEKRALALEHEHIMRVTQPELLIE